MTVRDCEIADGPQVEVSPSSFQKIKLLGKGDVGKVYLVREKKTDKLFAMKGQCTTLFGRHRPISIGTHAFHRRPASPLDRPTHAFQC
jgi:hypothetical protein